MPSMSETEWLAKWTAEENWLAVGCYQQWRDIGASPQSCLDQVIRAGYWKDPGKELGVLVRKIDFWYQHLNNTSVDSAKAVAADPQLAARCLASWLLLTPKELGWLQGIADGSVLSVDLDADDATEVLQIAKESQAEHDAWVEKKRRNRTLPFSFDLGQRSIWPYWWRAEPASYWSNDGWRALQKRRKASEEK